jgi:hypothetical protein
MKLKTLFARSAETPNPRFEGSAKRRSRSVPVALRAPAPPQPQR